MGTTSSSEQGSYLLPEFYEQIFGGREVGLSDVRAAVVCQSKSVVQASLSNPPISLFLSRTGLPFSIPTPIGLLDLYCELGYPPLT